MKKATVPTEPVDVTIDKLVHGGQALGTLDDGRKIFVWNALPGERVKARIIKQKKSFLEGIAQEVEGPSKDRIEPAEANYLSTSPWQMMTYEAENRYKREIIEELFVHEKVTLPSLKDVVSPEQEWNYRNKMEYSFWGDEEGIHLALHQRGSHGKQIVEGSKLALPAIDVAANAVIVQLNALNVRAGELKTIVVRANQNGETVAALFVKSKHFPGLRLAEELKGLNVYYSNPKSPASVPTELLYQRGDVVLTDTLLGADFIYDVDSFFQVNIPVFEKALTHIKSSIDAPRIADMYAGVGSIGLSVAEQEVVLVELDPATAAMARVNAAAARVKAEVVEASTDKVTEWITPDTPVIFDPPRAGLHQKVVDAVLNALPPQVIYLSCNPATQARDLAMLQDGYTIEQFEIYNFFPRTPHIETLAVLKRK